MAEVIGAFPLDGATLIMDGASLITVGDILVTAGATLIMATVTAIVTPIMATQIMVMEMVTEMAMLITEEEEVQIIMQAEAIRVDRMGIQAAGQVQVKEVPVIPIEGALIHEASLAEGQLIIEAVA